MTKIIRPLPKLEHFQPCLQEDNRCKPSNCSADCVDCMLADFSEVLIKPAMDIVHNLKDYVLFFNLDKRIVTFANLLISEIIDIHLMLVDNCSTSIKGVDNESSVE